MGWLKRFRPFRLLPQRLFGPLFALAGAAPLAISGRPVMAAFMLAGFVACYAASDSIARIGSYLRGEAKTFPASVTRILSGRQRSVWLCRVALALVSVAVLLVPAMNPILAATPVIAITATAIFLAYRTFGKRQALSDRIHDAEINRLLAWAHKEGVRDLIHVPDGEVATIKKIEALLLLMKKKGVKVGLICRGRKAYAKIRGKNSTSWLVRTAQDLDDFAMLPFLRCIHLDIGTNSTHLIGLRKLRQLLVDPAGRLNDAQQVPKECRMFDEIWLVNDPSDQFAENAQGYGITLENIMPKKTAPVLPSLPFGKRACAGIIVPATSSGEDDMSSLASAFEVATAFRKRCGNDSLLIIGFESGSATASKMMSEWLSVSFGKSVKIMTSTTTVLNTAPYLIWTPAAERVLPSFAKRAILKNQEDVDSIDVPVEVTDAPVKVTEAQGELNV